jgi:hypothetical protein
MTLQRLSSLAAIILLAASSAHAQVSPSNPLSLEEAKAWDKQMDAYEKAGDRRLAQGFRASTVLHVDLEPQPGARVSVALNGERLLAYTAQAGAQRKQLDAAYKVSQACNWYNDPKSGDAMETCTITSVPRTNRYPSVPAMYSFTLVSKDAAGLYVRESWVSDKKMF